MLQLALESIISKTALFQKNNYEAESQTIVETKMDPLTFFIVCGLLWICSDIWLYIVTSRGVICVLPCPPRIKASPDGDTEHSRG